MKTGVAVPHDLRAWESLMEQRHLPAAQQVQVAEHVTFPDGRRTVPLPCRTVTLRLARARRRSDPAAST